MIQLPYQGVIIQSSPIKTPPTLRLRAFAATLGLLAAAHAVPTQEQIRAALGSPPDLTWELTGSGSWEADGRGVVLGSPSPGSVHGLETTVTGPGEAHLSLSHSQSLMRSVWVDGVRSGVEGSSGFNSVAVGPGTHRLRWQVARSVTPGGSPASAVFHGAIWQPFGELPLAAGAAGGVTLTSPGANPWIGQDRLHHGDGGAAWSGLKIDPTASATDAPLTGDFDGPGVLVFRSKVTGNGLATYRIDGGLPTALSGDDWALVRLPVDAGRHLIQWRADLYPGITWRPSFEVAVDEVALLPYVSLAEALDTPGWAWTTAQGHGGLPAPYGIPEPTARGGSMVVASWGSRLSTRLEGSRLLKVRSRGWAPEVSFGDIDLTSAVLSRDPAANGWQDKLWELPAGEDVVHLAANHGTEVDYVEVLPAPATIAAAMGMAEDSLTTGGSSAWEVAPYAEVAGYGASVTARPDEGRSWLELPVSGPSELRFAWKSRSYNAKGRLLVNGKPMAVINGSTPSETIRVELPAGSHTVRWQVDAPADSGYPPFTVAIADLSIDPLPAEGGAMAALGMAQPVSLGGEWMPGTTYGREALESPASGSTEVQWSRDHEIRAHFNGPGELKFRWYLGTHPTTGRTASWRLDNPESGALWLTRDPYSGPAGWREESLWLPPGGALLEWSASGSAEEAALAALADVVFTPAATVSLGDAVEAPGLAWTTDPANPWLGVTPPQFGDDLALSPPLVKGASARLATTLQGPGRLSFRWRDFDTRTSLVQGEFHLAGQLADESVWRSDGEIVEVMVPFTDTVTAEWIARTRDWVEHPSDFLGVDSVTWQPYGERSLAASLDTGKKVAWKTSPTRPFTGRDDTGATGGSSAYVMLPHGEESWLEATVNGPGVFDFWLREAADSDLSPDPWEFWSLTIDGQPVEVSGTSWEPFWIPGAGTHRIRLTFRCPEDSSREWIAGAVDQVSWQPLKKISLAKAAGRAGLNWQSHGSPLPAGYSKGGRNGAAAIVLNPHAGEVTWVETTVKGPCELSWDSELHDGWSSDLYPRNSLQVDGHDVLPLHPHPWQRMRLTLPAGTHRVRWLCDPWLDPDYDNGREVFNAVWRIGGLRVRSGLSPLSQAVDAPGLFALETGDTGGKAVTVAGEKAWEPGRGTSLYFFDPQRAGKLTAVWGRPGLASSGWRHEDEDGYENDLWSDGAGWERLALGLKPGGFSRWRYEPQDWWDPTITPPVLASVTLDTFPTTTLEDAIESPSPVATEGWTGFTGPGAHIGGDAGWSFINRHGYGSHRSTEMPVHGPARLSFWWKREGTGRLSVSIDGGILPVPTTTGTWQAVELAIPSGDHVVRWLHESGPETSTTAPTEAWLDGCSLREDVARTLGQAAVLDPTLTLSTTGDDWHRVAHAEADGSWTEAVRTLSGSRVLTTTVTGPAVLRFRGRCFLGLPEDGDAPWRGRSSSVVIGGGGGGSSPEIVGHFLSARVDDQPALKIETASDGRWSDAEIHIPAGTHEVTFRLMTLQRWWFGESQVDAVAEDLQGWLDDLRVQPVSDHFSEWLADQLPSGDRHDPTADADGDGASNELEYWFGTAPGDPASVPPSLEIRPVPRRTAVPSRWLMIPYLPAPATAVLEASADLTEWQALDVALLRERPPSSWLLTLPGPTDTHHPWMIPDDGAAKYFRLRFPDPTE